MPAVIDKFGRVVIPRKLRREKGLAPGTKVDILPAENGVSIVPAKDKPLLRRKNGLLVYTGPWPKGLDIVEFIQQQREERIRHVCGLDK